MSFVSKNVPRTVRWLSSHLPASGRKSPVAEAGNVYPGQSPLDSSTSDLLLGAVTPVT